jgi:carboxypeptidase PM20D1
MKWVKRGFLAVLAILVLFVGIVVVRTALVRPAAGAAAPANLAPAPEINVDLATTHLCEAIRIQTISRTRGVVEDPEAFLAFHAFLQAAYPRVHAALQREVVADYSLLYTLPGTDPSLPPILLLAHQDVVPVEPGTEKDWDAPPFAGEVRGRAITGRGALDDKGNLVAIMEAMETLLERGFRPRRTVMLAFGHDEEVLGVGAKAVALLLKERNIRPWFVLDEGMVVVMDHPLTGKPAALIGVAEKGYLTVRVTARGEGGHSSAPPRETAVERLSRAILAIRARPFPAHLGEGPVGDMLDVLAPHLGFAQRAVISNRWAFGPLLRSRMDATPAGNAALRTTVAPTVIGGGTKENVLPQEVHALVNLRIYPGESVEGALEHLRNAVAGIAGISLETQGPVPETSPLSSTTSDSYALLASAAKAHAPEGAPVTPMLMIGTSDSRHFTKIAENVYRFMPQWLTQSQVGTIHGTGERLAVENLGHLVRFFAQLVETGAR